ncbi:MAG: aldo/keto reductase [Dehalococcoidia bacterium]|jgi:aryl-alcohol dehydrogenase-like predicted oxidoreductase|nr:aldo/keto reductase [Chloroflexota bacterium]MDP6055260.1 aldo/keto reductase [Dehalococcoidia bacterium]MDP7090425.1 aldo/keto reductase [Dehalococcoidia bacterium]MDP7261670.1 aldo/keto reductase [Dehalococcoidia bacterium]MDP7484897.1 aldo/keto reductase [Dehalococcoidia bacterium]
MEYKLFGRTGVYVSPLVLGCMMFGQKTDLKDTCKIVDYAIGEGINFLDTADVYGGGASEEFVGEALERSSKRNEVFLATKVNGRMSEEPNDIGTSRHHIIEGCEASLRRLKTDHIDLYQLHRPNPHIAIDETLFALDDLITSGKIRYAGSSNFGSWQVVESLWASEKLGKARFVSEQSPFNLADRRAEREHTQMCQTYSVAFIPWSPLAAGGLTGKYTRTAQQASGTRFGDETDPGKMKRFSDGVMDIAEGLVPIAETYNATVAQIALAWVAAQPGVTAPIAGPRTLDQFKDNLGALDVNLTQEDFDKIDQLAPPGTNVADYYEASFTPNAHRF